MAENPTLIAKEQDKGNSPPHPHPTTPVSARPTQPPVFIKATPSEQELRMFPIMFMEFFLNRL